MKYTEPVVEIVAFATEDVIACSEGDGNEMNKNNDF